MSINEKKDKNSYLEHSIAGNARGQEKRLNYGECTSDMRNGSRQPIVSAIKLLSESLLVLWSK